MARNIDITVSPEKTDRLLADLQEIDGLVSMRLQKGVSISPPGDVVSATVTSRSLQEVMRLLDRYELGKPAGVSTMSSEPDSLVDAKKSKELDRDWVEASWEEMETIISKDSNANTILLFLVCASGILAAVGIATNAIHVVIGGMLVAPGFMPLMRMTLGWTCQCQMVWKKGLWDFLLIYLILIVSAALTSLLLQALGSDPLPGKADYYQLSQPLLKYWTTVTPSSVIASAAASLAGAVLIATKRSVFTSGVMIGLALVPSASIIGMALVEGDVETMGAATKRWLVDIALILGISYLFFAGIKALRHKRRIAI